jgi:nucleotide-binding universal stress UspA family protein
MNDSFKKILLVTDGSENAKPAESYALKLAIRTGAELIIADTIRVPGSVEAGFQGHSDEIITQID